MIEFLMFINYNLNIKPLLVSTMRMNSKILLLALAIACLFQHIQSGRFLQRQKAPFDVKDVHPKMQIDESNQKENLDDPFSPRHPKGQKPFPKDSNRDEFPTRQESKQVWELYKPFDDKKDSTDQETRTKNNKENTQNFDELLTFGMLGGSVFLIFVLLKTCMRKRGRRAVRQMGLRTMYPMVHQQQQMYPSKQVLTRASQGQTSSIDQRIKCCQTELNRLKEIKQQALRQQFDRKKMEQQQRKIQMINLQRRQNFVQVPRQNQHYEPRAVFYGEQNVQYLQRQNLAHNNPPFQVKGVEPIRRERSNSFRTQISEQPIIQNQIKYRNGIPVGKPVRQNDNDSSFASEYPEV